MYIYIYIFSIHCIAFSGWHEFFSSSSSACFSSSFCVQGNPTFRLQCRNLQCYFTIVIIKFDPP